MPRLQKGRSSVAHSQSRRQTKTKGGALDQEGRGLKQNGQGQARGVSQRVTWELQACLSAAEESTRGSPAPMAQKDRPLAAGP